MLKIDWDTYASKKELKTAHGWTEKLVRRFLDQPDKTVTNRHHASGPPMCLYERKRIASIESSSEFQQAMEDVQKRRTRLNRAAEHRRAAAEQVIATIPIKLPRLGWQQLVRRVNAKCDMINPSEMHEEGEPVCMHSPCVTYLLEQMMPDEAQRHEAAVHAGVADRAGKVELRMKAKEKVLARIAEAYPVLRQECDHQLRPAERPRRF